jgi:hypothetical protein
MFSTEINLRIKSVTWRARNDCGISGQREKTNGSLGGMETVSEQAKEN